MPFQYQSVDIDDFSGGETDNYLKAAVNRAQRLENFIVLDTKKPRTRPGTRLDDAQNTPQIPLGAQRIGSLFSFDDSRLFVQSLNKLYTRDPVSYVPILGPNGENLFQSTSNLTAYAFTKWNHHIFITSSEMERVVKVYPDQSGVLQARTAGLPPLPNAPLVTPGPGSKSFIYAFTFEYPYQVKDQQFIDAGPPLLMGEMDSDDPMITPVQITGIPVYANGPGELYDVQNLQVGIYRSTNGGQTLYKVASVPNGTQSYADQTGDATLQATGITLYTTGDVQDNDAPPRAKFCHTINGITYYAHFTENGQTFTNSLRQSQADDPDSVPKAFQDDLEDEITGISSVQGVPIIGCKEHIYALSGSFDEVGRTGISHNRISDKAGCVSHESFVQTELGLFWAGRDGFYYTPEGQNVFKVSTHLNQRYKDRLATFRDRTYRIKGTYDPTKEQVYWTFSQNTTAVNQEECDMVWVMDLRSGASREMPFHTWSGSETFKPSAIAMHLKELYRGDALGFVLKFSTDYLTDPKINPSKTPATWDEETILWTYRSTAQNFGGSGSRKIANKMLVSCQNETNISLAMRAINDDGKVTREMAPLRWRRNFTWGDDEFFWGSSDFVWYYGGLIEADRRMGAKNLRFNYLQIELANDFTNITNSDENGLAHVDASLKTATLTGTGLWPTQGVDYFVYFASDNFRQGFRVLTRTDQTVVLEDLPGMLRPGVQKWQMKGYKKGEILSLNEYSISWALTSRSHDMYNKTDSGDLA